MEQRCDKAHSDNDMYE